LTVRLIPSCAIAPRARPPFAFAETPRAASWGHRTDSFASRRHESVRKILERGFVVARSLRPAESSCAADLFPLRKTGTHSIAGKAQLIETKRLTHRAGERDDASSIEA
jgi:hypothetical protein